MRQHPESERYRPGDNVPIRDRDQLEFLACECIEYEPDERNRQSEYDETVRDAPVPQGSTRLTAQIQIVRKPAAGHSEPEAAERTERREKNGNRHGRRRSH